MRFARVNSFAIFDVIGEMFLWWSDNSVEFTVKCLYGEAITVWSSLFQKTVEVCVSDIVEFTYSRERQGSLFFLTVSVIYHSYELCMYSGGIKVPSQTRCELHQISHTIVLITSIWIEWEHRCEKLQPVHRTCVSRTHSYYSISASGVVIVSTRLCRLLLGLLYRYCTCFTCYTSCRESSSVLHLFFSLSFQHLIHLYCT